MFLLGLCAILRFGTAAEIDASKMPAIVTSEFDRLNAVENSLTSLITKFQETAESYRSSSQELLPIDEIDRRVSILKDILGSIDALGQAVFPPINISIISLVLSNSTLSSEPAQLTLSKQSSGVIPESRDFPGWVVHEKAPVLTFKPLLPNVPALHGLNVTESVKLPCEVTQFEGVFFFNRAAKASHTFVLNGAKMIPFPLPEGLAKLEVKGLVNGAGGAPFCLPAFSLYYEQNTK
jgi:hypothetical protein